MGGWLLVAVALPCALALPMQPSEALISKLLGMGTEVPGAESKDNSLEEQPEEQAPPEPPRNKGPVLLAQKPRGDPRHYQHSVMENGMQVLNIWDPNSTQVAIAVAVTVGSFSDTQGFDGLAHLTEHAMFLGSVNYPEQSGFDGFLSELGGSSNAYTADEATVYYANLDVQGFSDCMKRFADVFHRPLFKPSWIWDEVSAVDSEHSKNRRSQEWILAQMFQSLADVRSPVQRFHTGDAETLKKEDKAVLAQKIMAFFDSNYCPPRMRLVTFGPDSLKYQLLQAQQTFGSIPAKGASGLCAAKPRSFASPKPYPQSSLRKMLRVQGLSTMPELHVMFPLPNLQPWLRSHPSAYVKHVLQYGGKDSLLVALRDQLGLATAISCGKEDNSAGSVLQVAFSLLPEGAEHVDAVLDTLFAFLEQARSSDQKAKAALLQSIGESAKLGYDWAGLADPEHAASDLAEEMTRLDPSELMAAESLVLDPSAARVHFVLERLRPENMNVVLVDAEGSDFWRQKPSNVRTLRHYETNYTVRSLDDAYPAWQRWAAKPRQPSESVHAEGVHTAELPSALLQRLGEVQHGHPKLSLQLPGAIQGLPVIRDLGHTSARPGMGKLGKLWGRSPQKVILAGSSSAPFQAELWYREGWILPVPKISALVALRRPQAQSPDAVSAKEAVDLEVGLRLLSEQMDVRLAELKETGTTWALSAGPKGFTLALGSFAPTAREGFSQVLQELRHGIDMEDPHAAQLRLHRVVGDFKRELEDNTQAVLQVAAGQRDTLLQPGSHSREELLAALSGSDVAINTAAQAVASRRQGELSAVSLVMGSCSVEESASLQAELLRQLGVGSKEVQLVSPETSERVRRVIRPAGPVELRGRNPRGDDTSVMLSTILVGVSTIQQRVLLSLLVNVLQQVIFQELRTKLQLGYSVGGSVSTVSNILTLSCYVQSETSPPDEAEAHCEKVLTTDFPKVLSEMSDEEFHHMMDAFKSEMLQKPWSQTEERDRFWSPILLGKCLELGSEMLKYAENVRKEDLLDGWRKAVMPEGETKARTKVTVKLFGVRHAVERSSAHEAAEMFGKMGLSDSATQRMLLERELTTVLQGPVSAKHRAQLLAMEGAGYFPQTLNCEVSPHPSSKETSAATLPFSVTPAHKAVDDAAADSGQAAAAVAADGSVVVDAASAGSEAAQAGSESTAADAVTQSEVATAAAKAINSGSVAAAAADSTSDAVDAAKVAALVREAALEAGLTSEQAAQVGKIAAGHAASNAGDDAKHKVPSGFSSVPAKGGGAIVAEQEHQQPQQTLVRREVQRVEAAIMSNLFKKGGLGALTEKQGAFAWKPKEEDEDVEQLPDIE